LLTDPIISRYDASVANQQQEKTVGITITLTDQDALDYMASITSIVPVAHVVPNAPAAAAPSIAAAVTSQTAPEETPGTLDPAIAFGRPAASAPPAATTAAPPTANPAPAAEPAAPVIRAKVPELDADGLPWDERIHSASRNKNQDGTWRIKRGISDQLKATVTAELKAAMAAPGIPLPPTTPTVPPAPPATDPRQTAIVWPHHPEYSPPATTVGLVPPAPTTAVPPPPTVAETPAVPLPAVPAPPSTTVPSPAASAAPSSFPEVLMALTRREAAGQITKASIDEACATLGIPSFALLAARPDLIPQFSKILGL
jgi:hypothetical protein